MKERYWTELVASLQFGRCVLVLGPEIEVEPPSGGEQQAPARTCANCLAAHLAEALKAENKEVPDQTLMAVAQQYEDDPEFGATSLRPEAGSFYQSCGQRPSATHRLLARLPFNLILSTSHDELLALALSEQGKHPLIARYHLRGDRRDNPELVGLGTMQAPLIYHLFGNAEVPESLVLSENDLLDLLVAIVSRNPPLPNSLIKALERTKSFLFVGFGIRHWYLRVLLKVMVRALNLPSSSRRFAMEPLGSLPQADRKEMVLFYQRGAQILLCDAMTLHGFLDELGGRLEAAGGYRGPTASLGTRPRVFISYTRADEALATRLSSSLDRESFDPWFDKGASLEGGDLWDSKIESGLRDTDFVLVIYSPSLLQKRDGYVNKEIALARRRGLSVRGAFLIPLRTVDLASDERIEELREYQEMPLREEQYEQDVRQLISLMRREFQRRNK